MLKMSFYIIDIINFFLIFFLLDYFNGARGNFLAKKLKNSLLTVLVLLLTAAVVCVPFSFFTVAKAALLTAAVIAYIIILGTRLFAEKRMAYTDVEAGKEENFSAKKVMVLVPHEDDEINLAGGVIEEYLKHGSEVYIVFSTNGDGDERHDMSKLGNVRIGEAIKALSVLGVPEKNIVFLGYGDGWDKSGAHIYNAPANETLRSRAGRLCRPHPFPYRKSAWQNKSPQHLPLLRYEIRRGLGFQDSRVQGPEPESALSSCAYRGIRKFLQTLSLQSLSRSRTLPVGKHLLLHLLNCRYPEKKR